MGPLSKAKQCKWLRCSSIGEASNNPGCSSGCYWQRSAENCSLNGISLWINRSKTLIKHIPPHTSQGDHRQLQVTDSLIIDGRRRCKAESWSWTEENKNSDDIAPSRKGRTQIPRPERLPEIVSAPHYSLIWSIIRLLALKFTLWKVIWFSNKALRHSTSEPRYHEDNDTGSSLLSAGVLSLKSKHWTHFP